MMRSMIVVLLVPTLASAGLPIARGPAVVSRPTVARVAPLGSSQAGAVRTAVAFRPGVGSLNLRTLGTPIPDKAALAAPMAKPGSVLGDSQAAFKNVSLAIERGPEFFDRTSRRIPMPDLPYSYGLSNPDQYYQWYDNTTGQYETEASKIRTSLQTALRSPLASAIKNALPVNTLYKVENRYSDISYAVRAQGDNPEKYNETEPLVVFTAAALRNLSPYYLAAKMAGAWAKHLYRDKMPNSAEKTYVEGSVMVRTFMQLTGSTASNWRGDLDYVNGGNFETYKHFYHWAQGFQYPNRRQGPYFVSKIMQDSGDPSVWVDPAGRRTLFQRSNDGQISGQQASDAQQTFDGFVSNENY